MRVAALAVQVTADETAVTVSVASGQVLRHRRGGWPEIGVDGLRAGLRGGEPFVEVDGGWIELRDRAVLDLYGFRSELSRIGFGRDGRLGWFSGSVQLVELLPSGQRSKRPGAWDPNPTSPCSPADRRSLVRAVGAGSAVQHAERARVLGSAYCSTGHHPRVRWRPAASAANCRLVAAVLVGFIRRRRTRSCSCP